MISAVAGAEGPRPAAVRLALAVISGVLFFLGFVGFGVYPLIFVAWVPLLAAVRGLAPWPAALVGLVAGTVANAGGYYWLVHVLTQFGDLGLAVALSALLVHCVYHGAMIGLVVYAVRRAQIDLALAPIWALPVAAVTVELLYPQLFPANLGAALHAVPALTQIVEITGVLGLTALVALVNGGVWELVDAALSRRGPSAWRLGIAAGAVTLVAGYGLVRLPMIDAEIARAPRLTVALVQTNIGAREKGERRDDFIARHQQMSREAVERHPGVDLLVWPESAYNRGLPRGVANVARPVTRDLPVPLIFGAVTYEGDAGRRRIYNSAIAALPTGDIVGRVDKTRLVAFSEAVPFLAPTSALGERVARWFPRASLFTPGTTVEPLRAAGASFLVTICYEGILPGVVRERWRRAGPPHALLNLTNDSWFGDSHEPRIHLALASLRSIESRRAMIRATNTGISALVDPAGRIYQQTAQWTPAILVGEVPLVTSGARPPYQVAGDVVGWLAAGLVVAGWVASRRAGRATAITAPAGRSRARHRESP